MEKIDKIYEQVLSGKSDCNIDFRDLRILLIWLGFSCRIKGDHFIYFKDNIPEILNIQPSGNKAKAYQVKQLRNLLLKYGIGGKHHV